MIAFYLPGGVPVDVFALLLGLGASLGLLWALNASKENQEILNLDGGLWMLLGSLLGARAAFVVVHWAYFQAHASEIFQLYRGGLTWAGAVAGGFLFVALYALLRRLPFVSLLDALLPLCTVLVASAWLGCWLDGCAYGRQSSAWWALPSVDEWGTFARRFPLQLVGAALILIAQWTIDAAGSFLKQPGAMTGAWLVLFSSQMLLVSFLRADPAPVWLGFRLDTLAAGAIFVLALVWSAGMALPARLHRQVNRV